MFSAKLFNALETKSAIGRIYILERTYVYHNSILLTNKKGSKSENIKLPEPPTNCCMSGCANCVWIEYAEELAKLFKDGGEKSKEIIMEKIDDPNMKAFLLTELSFLKSKEPS